MRQAKAQDFFSYRYFFWVRSECPFVAETAALQGFEAAHPPSRTLNAHSAA
jgi:hypothetical protein